MMYLLGAYLILGIVIEVFVVTKMDLLNADAWEDQEFDYSYKERCIGLAIAIPLLIPIAPILFSVGFVKEFIKK